MQHFTATFYGISMIPAKSTSKALLLASGEYYSIDVKKGTASIFPGIEKTRGVCGGRACIVRTRIPVWSIIKWQTMGMSETKLLKNFPTLVKSDILAANLYYSLYQTDIDNDIAENDTLQR